MARLVTPGWADDAAIVVVDLEDAVELAEAEKHAVGKGKAPPESEVPAPRGTTLIDLLVAVAAGRG